MAKYRTKPKIKIAEQWFPGKEVPGVITGGIDPYTRVGTEPHVVTIHGQKTRIAPGDYIVQEPDGIHYYPCKPDIWEAGHELVE